MLSKLTTFWDGKKQSILESKFTCITLRLSKIRIKYVYYHFQHRNNIIFCLILCVNYIWFNEESRLQVYWLVLQRTNITIPFWWTYWAPHREVIILMCPDKHNHFWLLPFLNMFNITTFHSLSVFYTAFLYSIFIRHFWTFLTHDFWFCFLECQINVRAYLVINIVGFAMHIIMI